MSPKKHQLKHFHKISHFICKHHLFYVCNSYHLLTSNRYCYECVNKATNERKCIVCGGHRPSPVGKMIYCDICPRAYHADCYIPPLLKVPRGKWYCHGCISKAPPPKKRSSTTKPRRERDSSGSLSSKRKDKHHNTSTSSEQLNTSAVDQHNLHNSSHDESMTSLPAPLR